MLGEALVSAILGLAVAGAALRWRPGRFRNRRLALATGPAAGAVGGLVARAVLGPGHPVVALVLAGSVAAALVSLLLERDPRSSPPAARACSEFPCEAAGELGTGPGRAG